MNYKCVIVTERGGPEVMQIVENILRPPTDKEVRVRVLAVPVCLPDVQARYGQTPIAPKVPFVPGYAIVGDVEAIGDGVKTAVPGNRVAALTVSGGYSEVIYLTEDKLIPVPASLDPAEVSTLILNYIVAYQTLHRSAKVKAGDKVLIIGASGGVGTALLQLGQLAGLKMYGIASASKHHILTAYGATPIDYHTQDFVEVMRQAEPDGLEAVIDGMGGDYLNRGFSLLNDGGVWVAYGNPLSFRGLLRLLGKLIWLNLLPNGKSLKLYGTTTSKFGKRPFLEDWPKLFNLLETRQIDPIIMQKFPLLEAAQANALLESGDVVGNVILVASEQ
ncbi:MAG: zinc-binding dehydrogenase [Anaerolineae bacterium]|nr:zinc-binding dehydrogenase [Anaerolineae bacterium]